MTKMNEAELVVWAAVFAREYRQETGLGIRLAAAAASGVIRDLRELAQDPKNLDEHTKVVLEQICPKMLPPGEY